MRGEKGVKKKRIVYFKTAGSSQKLEDTHKRELSYDERNLFDVNQI